MEINVPHRSRTNRISLKILLFVLIIVFLIAAIFSCASYFLLSSAYYSFFNDKTLLTNRIVAAQISGNELMPYIEALRGDKAFQEKQIKFFNARQKLMKLREKNVDSEEIQHLQEEMRGFYLENEKFKNDRYFRIQEQINELSQVAGAKYLYIVADTGIPGMYTYIFDARASMGQKRLELDRDDIGTIDSQEEFSGADAVFATGRQMPQALYQSDDVYGMLYYAYAPIFDSSGKVVAAVGTDIDLSEINGQIRTMMYSSAGISLLFSALLVLVFYLALQHIVVKPIITLTNTATRISEGQIYTDVPSWLFKRHDEMGLLGKALNAMSKAFQDMLTSTKQLFEAAVAGKLDVRNDPAKFEGDFSQLIRQINDTLDIIGIYFDSLPEAFFILDPQLKPVFKNRRFCHFFDHMDISSIVSRILGSGENAKGDLPTLGGKLKRALQSGTYVTSVWMTLPDNTENCFTFTCCELILNEVKRGTLIIASDVTDLMREKARAESASKAKGEFLSRVSHELRSPMNIIIGMAKLGLKEAVPPSKERFSSIVSASSHLLQIINDVLDMSRIESGKIEIKYSQFDLHVLIADCFDLMRLQTEEKRLDFTYAIAPDVAVEVVGDPARVSQVLVNLLSNAVKFTEEGGRVTLSVASVECGDGNLNVAFAVEDTGIGMTKEFMEKIFVPFEQEDQYIQRRYQGTGLGLSISHRLVVLMGGEIEVESQPGAGSRFTFTLPFMHAEPEAAETVEGADRTKDVVAYDFSGLHLLLVDDIALNRTIVTESLAETNIDITEADDGAEALRLFTDSREGYFDLIFMDIQMPRMDGYQATQAIRALLRKDAQRVPIVAMTANALQEDVENALAQGMNGHLAKPIDIEECIRTIARFAVHTPSA